LLHEISKRKESQSTKNATLFNKTHKANKKLCFYCKKPGHFVRNCLKKKSDDKKKANEICEDQEQMFVVALSVNDHTAYNWIINPGATQHMTFKQESLVKNTPFCNYIFNYCSTINQIKNYTYNYNFFLQLEIIFCNC
jgi:hypothetical protein